jgi:hypothetical protein
VRLLAAALALLTSGTVSPTAVAFRRHEVGVPLANRNLASIDGKRIPILADGKVSVIVFARTGQERSETVLRQLAQLEGEVAAKPVRLVLIFSDTESKDDVRALVQATGVKMPVLVDEADALYGDLGVAMHPSAGIFGKDRKLVGFQPFRQINYLDAMRGRVRFALGEIDEAALATILDPPPTPLLSTGGGRAKARLKLARTLLASGMVDGAIENARAGIALEPELADAHVALAEALAKGGKCDESAREIAAARRLPGGADVHAPPCPAR